MHSCDHTLFLQLQKGGEGVMHELSVITLTFARSGSEMVNEEGQEVKTTKCCNNF